MQTKGRRAQGDAEKQWARVFALAKKKGFVTTIDLHEMFGRSIAMYRKRLEAAVAAGYFRRAEGSLLGQCGRRGRPETRYVPV